MVTVKYTGDKPLKFYQMERKQLVSIINDEATKLETDLVENTPGDRGGLRRGWSIKLANEKRLSAVVGQSSSYFLAAELGRKPGKGISQQGQQDVAKWALRNKILKKPEGQKKAFNKPQAAKSFAYLLSQKYKREGRPAMGFAGLANEGDPAPNSLGSILTPKGGPILAGFNRLKSRLN